MNHQKHAKRSKQWINMKDIAGYCMVSQVTVLRWIDDNKLSSMRLPSGHHRITIEDFRAFLKRNNMPVKGELLESKSKKKGGD